MTKPALNKLCKIWQARLLLQDWGVEAVFTRDLGCMGKVEWDAREMTALISIEPSEGVEETLIHELLHLRLYKIRLTEELELAINLLVRGFMKAYHRGRK